MDSLAVRLHNCMIETAGNQTVHLNGKKILPLYVSLGINNSFIDALGRT